MHHLSFNKKLREEPDQSKILLIKCIWLTKNQPVWLHL